jgi:uncharacterized protein YjiS (DUF1127 family)
MEMHSRQSLYEIHGISIERRRPRLVARLLTARIAAFMTKVKRRAMTELAEMDDHMLRDLGLHRSDIEGRLRRQRVNVGTDDASVFSNTTARRHPDLPTVNSPLISPDGQPKRESRKLHSSW